MDNMETLGPPPPYDDKRSGAGVCSNLSFLPSQWCIFDLLPGAGVLPKDPTLSLGFMTGTIASMHETKAVILAMIITTVITITVTVFSFQTKIYWVHMLYSAICAIIFTLFLAYDTQLLLGNKRFSISPEDYVYGAIQIYVDVIYIFLSFLRLGSRR
ncbi:Transmembrane BAX inhibitor motif-containing protein 1 [Ophiophagus hannah]|uniref:Transmembrane BAX inhibitor motif-containing protein 1 n=1 Tax=Ophiophagus hannah TaxID=8665 RepID=V8NXX9_OPHHA|nr:Transmembrane BAX inhibitor motif-containing protein 1 [Ophiophagus hannah]